MEHDFRRDIGPSSDRARQQGVRGHRGADRHRTDPSRPTALLRLELSAPDQGVRADRGRSGRREAEVPGEPPLPVTGVPILPGTIPRPTCSRCVHRPPPLAARPGPRSRLSRSSSADLRTCVRCCRVTLRGRRNPLPTLSPSAARNGQDGSAFSAHARPRKAERPAGRVRPLRRVIGIGSYTESPTGPALRAVDAGRRAAR